MVGEVGGFGWEELRLALNGNGEAWSGIARSGVGDLYTREMLG